MSIEADLRWLRRAIASSGESRAQGNHPFAALVVAGDGTLIAEGRNDYRNDCTCHAEIAAVRIASSRRAIDELRAATLYSSAEPCAMCAGAIYWSGIGRVVFGLSEKRLLEITGSHPENPTLALPCREVFARGQREIAVTGPLLEDEAALPHEGFWNR